MPEEKNLTAACKVMDAILNGKTLSHEQLIAFIKSSIVILPTYSNFVSSDIENLAFQYEKIYGSKTFTPGSTIVSKKEGYDIWFNQKKKAMSPDDHAFENRYREYLSIEHFATSAIENIHVDTEKVLSLCADPNSTEKVRGMVVGDVQSGKTANYLALANMACDYGYRLVLILAGLTDSLRIQTQERVDEGFIGAKSDTIGNTIEYTGVGKLGMTCSYYAVPLTTVAGDFEKISMASTDISKPVILVVKKNKAVLTAVRQWLKPGSPNLASKNILIIDDECDNASVNTKTDEDPSTINRLIRDIYNNYSCATYIGYTATPFANIFINPTNDDGNDDLFPDDFIHRLKASPESYFGVDKVFPKNDKSKYLTILNENEPDFVPVKHKKDYELHTLPRSLKDAILNFLICNCIRTIRGDGKKHRTMMINISSYNNVQESIKENVDLYVNNLRNAIFQYDKYKIEKFCKHPELKRLYEMYEHDDFFNVKSTEYPFLSIKEQVPFEKIKEKLWDEIQYFQTHIINNKYKGDQRFNYDDCREYGARLIAIGGFVLSRGLTLQGLITSYYSRNASAYDTLLQMCRWFGYRPNYEDLCRVYLSQINKDAFGAVIDAIKNLDEQFEVMRVQGKRPREFGLMVQESPDTLETNLLITARNKAKHTRVIERRLNYAGVTIDTSKLYKSFEANAKNLKVVDEFYDDLIENGFEFQPDVNGRQMFLNVDSELISKFIKKIKIPLENRKFDVEALSDFISKNEYFDKWDVVYATGLRDNERSNYYIGRSNCCIPPIKRSFDARLEEDIVRISKGNNRLIEPGIFNSGLSAQQIEEAKNNARNRELLKKKTLSSDPDLIASDYLNVKNRRPLLVILPINLVHDVEEDAVTCEYKEKVIKSLAGKPLIGFGIGFSGKEGGAITKYRINEVKINQLKNAFIEEDIIND